MEGARSTSQRYSVGLNCWILYVVSHIPYKKRACGGGRVVLP
jgi:hypothetical protein